MKIWLTDRSVIRDEEVERGRWGGEVAERYSLSPSPGEGGGEETMDRTLRKGREGWREGCPFK